MLFERVCNEKQSSVPVTFMQYMLKGVFTLLHIGPTRSLSVRLQHSCPVW